MPLISDDSFERLIGDEFPDQSSITDIPSASTTIDDSDIDLIINEVKTEFLQSPEKVKASGIELTQISQTQVVCNRPDKEPSRVKAPIYDYGRHIVKAVTRMQNGSLQLDLESVDGSSRQCSLEGFWKNTLVQVGDAVNLISDNLDLINDKHGLLVVSPDQLLSGTAVVGSLFCPRKSALSDVFPMNGYGSPVMLKGSILHLIFEDAAKQANFSPEFIERLIQNVETDLNFLHSVYALGVEEREFFNEVREFIPGITGFKKYLGSKISQVVTTEQSIWSPKYGIKGKVDMIVRTQDGQTVPLEVKTGKASFSSEHRGQVLLYSLLMNEKGCKADSGFLLYLRDTMLQTVPVNEREIRGLIQMRNELAYYLRAFLRKDTCDGDKVVYSLGSLPEPLNSQRFCGNCEYLHICSMIQRDVEHWDPPADHVMSHLCNDALQHLSVEDVSFFLRFALLLLIEKRTSKSKLKPEHIWMYTAEERQQSGLAFASLTITRSDRISSESFSVSFQKADCKSLPSTSITVGDTVVISDYSGRDICLCFARVLSIESHHLSVSTDTDLSQLHHSCFRADKWESAVGSSTAMSNMCHLMDTSEHSERLRRLIAHHAKPQFDTQLSKSALQKIRPVFKSMNRSQKTVLMKVILAKDYVVVKGYPGTGKSATIVAMIKILSILGKSVLLTGYTHTSVDNILLKLKKSDVSFLRLGQLERIHPELRDFAETNQASTCKSVEDLHQLYQSHNIVACTCLGIGHCLFARRRFDVCIVDEASQVLLPICLGPLFLADKFVLVGDPKQLPPIVKSADAKELDTSLIDHLDKPGATYELTLQYRMNSEILRLSNNLVYEGKLVCANDKVANLSLGDVASADDPVVEAWRVFSPSVPVIFLDTGDLCNCPYDSVLQTKNDTEAEIIHRIVDSFSQHLPRCDIGVIAPYRNQVKLLKEKLSRFDCEINTVDQYQGRDKSVIIVSFTRCQPCRCSGNADILEDLRRLNVAITRAKMKLIFVGNMQVLRGIKTVEKLINILTPEQVFHVSREHLSSRM